MLIDYVSYFHEYGIKLAPRHKFIVDWYDTIWDIGFAKWPRRRDVYRPEEYAFDDIFSFCDRFNENSVLGNVAERAYYKVEFDVPAFHRELGPDWDHTVKCLCEVFGEHESKTCRIGYDLGLGRIIPIDRLGVLTSPTK